MKQNIHKKGHFLLITSVSILLMSLTIGAYLKYSTDIILYEFNKDLATLRGYWAVYGAKELSSSIAYKYYRITTNDELYDVNSTKFGLEYDWNLTNTSNSGIKDDMLFHRKLKVDINDNNKILSYK